MPKTKTIEGALRWADGALRAKGIPEAGRESEEILGRLLAFDRTALLTHGQTLITANKFQLFSRLISQRAAGWPLAYLTGQQPFYGLDFIVSRRVLIPRPETEGLVDWALSLIAPNARRLIADLGTGSGCIAVTIAKLRPNCKIFALDRSRPALKIAKLNARRHQVSRRISFKSGHLLAPLLNQRLDLIIANLPYLTPQEINNEPSIRYEPRLALNAGLDGLGPFSDLFKQIARRTDQTRILLEIDPRRIKGLERLTTKMLPGRQIKWHKDIFGRIRYELIESKAKPAGASPS